VFVVRFIMLAYLSPRERLDQIWRVSAQYFIYFGLHNIALACSGLFPLNARSWGLSGATCIMMGIIIGRPHFRMRAQAFLNSRGHTRSLSAAIAAAIGNHSVEEVEKKAARHLRYVTLDKISKEELAEKTPNPLLYERSMPGRFGEVDAFISHSWSDPSTASGMVFKAGETTSSVNMEGSLEFGLTSIVSIT
jgi:hypothetical protein